MITIVLLFIFFLYLDCDDKLILETILQDKFFYFKAEERGVAVATATDDNAEIRNLDVRLFKKSTCRYTSCIWIFIITTNHIFCVS